MAGVLTEAMKLRLAPALSAAVALALLLAATSVMAMSRTPHNLRNLQSLLAPGAAPAAAEQPALAPRRAGASADSRQLCVFCHTPEAVSAADARLPPRWQRAVTNDFRYAAYVGELVQPGAPLGPDGLDALGHSMVCLSCHDAVLAPLATGRSDDHPIGVPYRGTATSLGDGAALNLPPEPLSPRELRRIGLPDYRPPSSAVMNERLVWWASSSRNPAQRTRSDLPLYPRRQAAADGSAAEDVPFIECGTCHDPHSGNALFLRVPNASGQLCLTCHNK